MIGPNSSSTGTGGARMWLLVAITVVIVGWALRAMGAFMVPVVFSVFLALLMAPLDRKVSDSVPGKLSWLGHLAAMGAIVVALLAFVGLFWLAAQQLLERFPVSENGGSLLPQFGGEVREGSAESSGSAAGSPAASISGGGEANASAGSAAEEQTSAFIGMIHRLGEVVAGAGGSLVDRFREWASGMATEVLSAAGTTLFATFLVFFLTLIMLIEGPRWRQKVVCLLEVAARRKAMHAVDMITELLRRYLLARTVLGAITAVLYVAWLWVFGVDLLVVWGLLAFLLNYLPTVGSLIAGVLPVLYAFVQKDVGTAVAVGAGIFVIEQVMGNYVDPRVQGRQVSLSSLVVMIALLLWSWVWGIAGAILAVPLTIAAMIVCAHIHPLRPFALLLSNAVDIEGLDKQAGRSDR